MTTIITDGLEVTEDQVKLGQVSVVVQGDPVANPTVELLRTLVDRTAPIVHQPTPRFTPPPLPPAEPKAPKTFPVRTLDADASAALGARVFRLGDAISVEFDQGWTDADRQRAESRLGACQLVGEYRPPVRQLDQQLTDRLKAAGLAYVRATSIEGASPQLVWSRDPSEADLQLARDLLV